VNVKNVGKKKLTPLHLRLVDVKKKEKEKRKSWKVESTQKERKLTQIAVVR
jgi:hypothetical protein